MEPTAVSTNNTSDKTPDDVGVKIIGVGGAGCGVLRKIAALSLPGIQLIPCHTDFSQLMAFPRVIPLGSFGVGSGLNDEQANHWALEQKPAIQEILGISTKVLILITGLGGGTGSGATPVIAEIARNLGILTVAIVTMPFESEGYETGQVAKTRLRQLMKTCDAVVAFSMDKLEENIGDVSIHEFYEYTDDLLLKVARIIPDIACTSSNISTDLLDVKAVLNNSGPAFFTHFVTSSASRVNECITTIERFSKQHRSLPIDAQRMLMVFKYSPEHPLTMGEMKPIVQSLHKTIARDVKLFKIGMVEDPSLDTNLQVSIIAGKFLSLENEN